MMDPGPLPIPGQSYDQLWASQMIRILRKFFNNLDGIWISKSELVTQAGRTKKTTLITDATYTIKKTDHIIDVNRAGAVTLTLPETPRFGQEFVVYDSSGAAATNNITVAESATYEVNGDASVVMRTNYGSMTIRFNGTLYIAR